MVDYINKPRGMASAYVYYIKINQEELMKKQQFGNFAVFSEACSQGWRDLKREDKKRFEDMARTDRERYEREMKSYVPPKGSEKKGAFLAFIRDKGGKIKELNLGSFGEVVMALGKLWNELNPEDRAPYERKAAQLRERKAAQLRERKAAQLGDKYN